MTSTLARSTLVAVAFLLAGATAHAQPVERDHRAAKKGPVVLDRVVAVVNEEIILSTELNIHVAPMLADLDQITDERERERRRAKITSQTLEDMVNDELMVQAALEAKLEVKDKEVQGALDEVKKQNKLDDEGLREALAMQGYTLASYKKDVRRQILRMRAVNMLVRPRVSITDEDVRARYDSMNRRSASVSKVHLHHVLVALPDKPSEQQVALAKGRAAEIIDKAKAGEDFAALARQYSDDPNTRDVGGDLGLIERGSIATEWEVIVFSMEQGEVRGPVSGPRGLHVFYVSEVVKTDVKPFEELKEQLRNELYRTEMEKQTRIWMEDLRKNAHVVML